MPERSWRLASHLYTPGPRREAQMDDSALAVLPRVPGQAAGRAKFMHEWYFRRQRRGITRRSVPGPI